MTQRAVSMRNLRLLGWTLVASLASAYLVYFVSAQFFAAGPPGNSEPDHATIRTDGQCQCIPMEKSRPENIV